MYRMLKSNSERAAAEAISLTQDLVRAASPSLAESGVAERVRCVRAAVHPTWRTGRLVPGPAGNSGMARVADGGDSGTVPVVRLDDLLWDERVGLLKVDVEGNALGVIESGRRVIERDRPLIVAEAGAQKDAITRLLGELGYNPPQKKDRAE